MNLALIPARGGSKRIPRKNIRVFRGRPIIAWSIQAARDAGCFDRILVSTDDDEIASVACSYGAEVPFRRPAHLATDECATQAVVTNAIKWCELQGQAPDAVCCLYATAPFVQPEELLAGRDLLKQAPAGSFVFTATSFPFPIQRAIRINLMGKSEMIYSEHFYTRSQDLEEAFHDAGQFYWARPQAWSSSLNIFDGGLPLVLPRWRVQDIDTEEDWIRAELLHNLLEKFGSLDTSIQ